MKINLLEIPESGQSWSLTHKTAEINEDLRDLIGNAGYQIEFTIRPFGAAATYELKGKLKTESPEQCSRCALDFQLPIEGTIHQLLMPAVATPRDAQFSKVNHFSDLHQTTLEVTEYFAHVFDVGEFFHEFIGLAQPFNPAPPEDEKGRCVLCKIAVKNHNFGYQEDSVPKHKPFASLKGVKLNL